MQILRSPQVAADAVAALPDYTADRRWVEIPAGAPDAAGQDQQLRVHLVDAGDPAAPVLVLLHGNPSWSYLWRHQITVAVAAGYRVIAPDLVGMGLSDKPSQMTDYTVDAHVAWMRSLLFDELDVRNATFVLHDWGGIIGMCLAAEQPDRVNRMVISNTGLPWRDIAEPLPEIVDATGPFADFQAMAAVAPVWEPWALLPMTLATEPSAELTAAYRSPYPDPSLTIGSRAFTQLLPTRPDNPMYPTTSAAWKVLETWDKPVLTIFSDKDAVAPDGWKPIVARIPGAIGQPHVILDGGGHFLQEDLPEQYTAALMNWLGAPE